VLKCIHEIGPDYFLHLKLEIYGNKIVQLLIHNTFRTVASTFRHSSWELAQPLMSLGTIIIKRKPAEIVYGAYAPGALC